MKCACNVVLLCFLLVSNIWAADKAYIFILGTAQDGGFPHAGCRKYCCKSAWRNSSLQRYVVSFALVDSIASRWWLFEASPDIKFQLVLFRRLTKARYNELPDGIFITHAHIGHYTGLMQLGREVMNTTSVPVYVLSRMKQYLESNGPWSQLVNLHNIELHSLTEDSLITLSDNIRVQPMKVPHRDEFSETAGFKILTTAKSYLFIPDIDKWQKWNRDIRNEVRSVDIALLDGTFYGADELPNRKISEVPHPFIPESMELFASESAAVRTKIYFIHFNHTNPLLLYGAERRAFRRSSFHLAEQGQRL